MFVDSLAPDAGLRPLDAIIVLPETGWDDALHQSAELGALGESVHLALRLVQGAIERVERTVPLPAYRLGDALVLQALRAHVRDAELALDRAIRTLESLFPRSNDERALLASGMDRRRSTEA